MIDVNPSHLSRALRGADRARPSVDLIRRVTRALDLPPGYFPEVREAALIEALTRNPALRDRLYRQLHLDDL
jgi:transcriptional regulator with XRE-family HTH domain